MNADHDYIHKNKNLKGFGSYGDIMIRDRKMYVAPTPYALITGTDRQTTLITPNDFLQSEALREFGSFERVESLKLIRGYSFDMINNSLNPTYVSNPNAGRIHRFRAFRPKDDFGPQVTLK